MIQVRDLSYRIGNRTLLDDINFDVRGGELVSVIGANGAGKSTLLKAISGDIGAGRGCISVNGKPLDSYNTADLCRMRGVLAQQTIVNSQLSVLELVLMGRYPHFGARPGLRDLDIVHAVLTETDMIRFTDRAYNTLSGGEQQRAQLSRVLAQIYEADSALLLLDEPTTGLDVLYQQQILKIARSMADRGHAVICVLHDMGFANFYSDKILLLKDGRMVAFDAPSKAMTEENIEIAFNLKMKNVEVEGLSMPLMVPHQYFTQNKL